MSQLGQGVPGWLCRLVNHGILEEKRVAGTVWMVRVIDDRRFDAEAERLRAAACEQLLLEPRMTVIGLIQQRVQEAIALASGAREKAVQDELGSMYLDGVLTEVQVEMYATPSRIKIHVVLACDGSAHDFQVPL